MRFWRSCHNTFIRWIPCIGEPQQLWKIKFYVDSARKNFEQAQQRTSHKQDQEI